MNIAAHKKRPPLHSLERFLLGIVGTHLVFLPWAFGTVHPWSQITSCVLALAGFVVALWPRHYTADESEMGEFVLKPWPRLWRFPLFWLGLALLAYMLVQALNPAWQWETNGKMWWLKKVPNIAWLPTSTSTPFERYNLWRVFLVYASAWLTVCALWIGITRRRSLQILLGVLVGNAVVLSIAGIVRAMSGERRILWIRDVRGGYGFASFIYHNHGAAYVALMAVLCLALAGWHHFEARRRMARSSPAMVWVLGAILMTLGVAYSTSRAGLGILLFTYLVSGIIYWRVKPQEAVPSTTPPLVTLTLFALVFGCAGFVVMKSDLSAITNKVAVLMKEGEKEESYQGRILVRGHAWRMLSDTGLRGSGAGSFQFLFPQYIQNTPSIYRGGQMFWGHAHIDWLEIPIELGLVGCALIASAFGWCVWRWARWSGWRHPVAVMLLLGCLQTLLHALIDFPFQSGAILVTWWALLIIALRWLEFDEAR